MTARRTIELRSDTFTLPTPAMRRAMADAEVGDDQYGEDPTVNRLERRSAEIVGKEAAVYVASGMLGNLCGVLSQTERGDEVILGDLAHIYQNEMGAAFVLGSIQPRLVPNRTGLPGLEDIEGAIRPAKLAPSSGSPATDSHPRGSFDSEPFRTSARTSWPRARSLETSERPR